MKDIFIVRHGQSEANANVKGLLSGEGNEYVIDSKFGLTELGKKQAHEAGKKISLKMQDKKYNIYISPYERTRETAEELENALFEEGHLVCSRIEDPRLVEQDFGDFDIQFRESWKQISPHSFKVNQAKYHDPAGRFFARFENGENLLDVYNRASLFVATRLERDIERNKSVNTSIIVTHNNTAKVMLMFLLGMQIESFNELGVLGNACILHIRFNEALQKYEYLGEI